MSPNEQPCLYLLVSAPDEYQLHVLAECLLENS